jgi:PAS domain-containing protein
VGVEESKQPDVGALGPGSGVEETAGSSTCAWIEDILERLGIGVIEVDNRTRKFTKVTPATARMMGIPSSAMMVGQSTSALIADPKERAESVARFSTDAALRERGWLRFEVQRTRYDNGAPVDLLVSLTTDYDDTGELT